MLYESGGIICVPWTHSLLIYLELVKYIGISLKCPEREKKRLKGSDHSVGFIYCFLLYVNSIAYILLKILLLFLM